MNELAVAAENGQIGDLLKPLIREIYLFDSYIAGTTHLKDQTVLNAIKVGDKWNCQEMCSRGIPKIMDRQESGGVMRELL